MRLTFLACLLHAGFCPKTSVTCNSLLRCDEKVYFGSIVKIAGFYVQGYKALDL